MDADGSGSCEYDVVMEITDIKAVHAAAGHDDLKERENVFTLANRRPVLVWCGSFTESPRGISFAIMVSAVTCERGLGECKDPA